MTTVNKLGDIGFLYDEKPFALPLQAWSSVKNVRFFDGSVYSTFGHSAVMGVPRVRSYFLKGALDNGDLPVFAYCGTAKVWATDGLSHADITRAAGDYTGAEADQWNGFNFGNITVLNNGVDIPQAWITPDLGTPLVDLPNWQSTVRAKVLRGFRKYLVALDVTKGATRYKNLVKWSHVADNLGAVPSSWDETNPDIDAGEYPLTDTDGPVVDCLPISDDVNIVYKSDAVYAMRWTGGQYVFQLPLLHQSWGLLSQRCVGMWNRRHIAISPDNLFAFDGVTYESLMKRRILRWWQNRIDSANAGKTFLVINHVEAEAWICFPETGHTWPNLALIISLEGGMPTVRDLPDVAHIDYNRVSSPSGETIDDWNLPFDNMVGFFDQSSQNPHKKQLVGVSPYKMRNNVTHSEELDNAAWTKVDVTVTADTVGTYDKIIPNTNNTPHYIKFTTGMKAVAEVGTFTAVCEATAQGYSLLRLWPYSVESSQSAWAEFDLLTGAVQATGFEGDFDVVTAGAQEVSTGVWRCWITFRTDADPAMNLAVYVKQNAGGPDIYAGNGTDGIAVGKLMVREGANFFPYQITTTHAQGSAFFLYDSGSSFDGEAFESFCERLGLSIVGQNRDGTPRVDPRQKVMLTGLWPKIELLAGTSIEISVGGQETPEEEVMWQTRAYHPSELVCNFDIETRYIAVKYRSADGQFWRLSEHDFDVAPLGKF